MKTNPCPSAPLNLCPPTGVSSSPREVFIRMVRDCWMVLYVNRKPGSRHSPGQFHAPSHSLDYVKAWVNSNPKLKLVEAKEKTVKCVSYFYPTSDNAKRFSLPAGGYDVGLTVLSTEKDSCTTEACAGFATEAEAMAHAETLPFEWASWQRKKGLAPSPASPVKDTPDFSGLASIFDKAELASRETATAPASPVDSVGVPQPTYLMVEGTRKDIPVNASSRLCVEFSDGTHKEFIVADLSASHAAKDAKIKALEDAVKDLLAQDGIRYLSIDSRKAARAALALPCASLGS